MIKSRLYLGLSIILVGLMVFIFRSVVPAAPNAGTINVDTTIDQFGTGAECSLREAVQSANSNSDYGGCTRIGTAPYTINLLSTTYTLTGPGGDEFNASGDLDIWVSLTIKGTGAANTIIQAGASTDAGVDRVIHVTASGTTITLQGVTIRHGRLATSGEGGGIFRAGLGTLNIVDSVVTQNRAEGSGFGGGGIASYGGTVNIQNSTISGNAASGISAGNAGGIYNDGCTLNITDNSIIGGAAANTAKFGAGIFNVQGGTVIIDNSTVSSNTATINGGGILNSDLGSTITITNGSLVGGVNGNTANFGAGIFNVQSAVINIDGSTISGNKAANEGGGIFTVGSGSTTNILNGSLVGGVNGNTAKYGGGIWNGFGGTISIYNSTVSNNAAADEGGGISNSGSGIAAIRNSTIISNTSNVGGGIYSVDMTTLTIDHSTVSSNTASVDGGGIFSTDNSTVTITNTSVIGGLRGNFAHDFGGGIYVVDTRLVIDNSTVHGNVAGVGGGGVHNGGPDGLVIIQNGSLIGGKFANKAIIGGGIYNDVEGDIVIKRSTVSSNTATSAGGGIFIVDSGSVLSIDQSTINGNNAINEGGGGILAWDGVHAELVNSTISGNLTQWGGGGIASFTSTFTLTNVTITDNQADSDDNGNGDGGGIYYSGDSTSVFNIVNTIIAANVNGVSNPSPDCFGSFNSMGHNLIGDNSACTGFTNSVNGDVVGKPVSPVDPMLGELTDNGGKTWTHALLTGSKAINTGDNPVCQSILVNSVDQRGQPRPDFSSLCDMGAYERHIKISLPFVVK